MKPRHPLRNHARELRNNATDVERILWQHLRKRQMADTKFRRQQPIGPFIVDFVSFDKKIVVELDGGHHAEDAANDRRRDACLGANGLVVLRFWNNEIVEHLEGVLERIRAECLRRGSPTP